MESRWLYPSVWNHPLATVSSPQQAPPRPTRYLAQHRRHTPLKPPHTPGALSSPDISNRPKPTDGDYVVGTPENTLEYSAALRLSRELHTTFTASPASRGTVEYGLFVTENAALAGVTGAIASGSPPISDCAVALIPRLVNHPNTKSATWRRRPSRMSIRNRARNWHG